MDTTIPHFVAGKLEKSPTHAYHTVYDPAIGEPIAKVPLANTSLIHETIIIAKQAFQNWKETPIPKRTECLFKFRELLIRHTSELGEHITREHGKTKEDAIASIQRGIEAVEYYCSATQALTGRITMNASRLVDTTTYNEPLGVAVGISPFNFPVMVPIWMIIPAIVSGNTFILKPSPQTPSAPLFLMELLREAGVPNGVVNLLHGDTETVTALITHKSVATVTAVASSHVAKSIYETAILHGKRAHTFGGAKNHAVILNDANLEDAAHTICGAAFGSAGERCMAISVVICVGDEVADNFLTHLIPLIQKIRIDAGNANHCDMGPLISSTHRAQVLKAIDKGVSEGAKLLIDGRDFKHPRYPKGFFIGPSLFDQVTKNMSVYLEEIFGPVLLVLRTHTLEDAITLVNEHRYGNGTAIFTQNPTQARRYANAVSVGMIGINIPIPVPIVSHPFGGMKDSFYGDTLMHGNESFQFYTRPKTIISKWQTLKKTSFSLPQQGEA